MKQSQKNFLAYLAVVVGQSVLYQLLGSFNSTPFQLGRTLNLSLGIDTLVPFLPQTIWAYCFYYVIIIMGFVLSKDEENFPGILRSFLLLTFLSDLVFVLVPVSVPLSPLPVGQIDGLSDTLYRTVIGLDTRSNCFPSLHCGHSFLMAYWFWKSPHSRSLAKIVTAMAILVMISTLTLKQHWFLDIVGAVLFSFPLMRFHEKRLQHQRI